MVLRRIRQGGDEIELWWDSLPDSREYWLERIAGGAPPERRGRVREELGLFFDLDSPDPAAMKGATSNPRLVWESVAMHEGTWARYVKEIAREGAGSAELYWDLYRSVFTLNSRIMMPLWERSGGRYGWVCAQIPPGSPSDAAEMTRQGLELAALNPNLMIKVAGSERGFEAIEALTGRGVSTNCTLSFSVSQARCALRAVERGLEQAARRGLDLSRWRAVATFMAGRLGAEEELRRQAAGMGISLTPERVRWVELLVLKEIHRLLSGGVHPLKLLLCSLKADPPGGNSPCLHIEKSAGADCVYTLSPPFLAELLNMDGLDIRPSSILEEAPPGLEPERLLEIPYVRRVYEREGMLPEEFEEHPVFRRGSAEAETAYRRTLDFIERNMAGSGSR